MATVYFPNGARAQMPMTVEQFWEGTARLGGIPVAHVIDRLPPPEPFSIAEQLPPPSIAVPTKATGPIGEADVPELAKVLYKHQGIPFDFRLLYKQARPEMTDAEYDALFVLPKELWTERRHHAAYRSTFIKILANAVELLQRERPNELVFEKRQPGNNATKPMWYVLYPKGTGCPPFPWEKQPNGEQPK